MNSEGKAPASICNLSALAAIRLRAPLKREVLGPTGLLRPMIRGTMLSVAYHVEWNSIKFHKTFYNNKLLVI